MADEEDETWEYPEFVAVTYRNGETSIFPVVQGLDDGDLSEFLLDLIRNKINHEDAVKIEIPPEVSMVKEGYEDENEE